MSHLRIEDTIEQINEQVDQEIHDQHEQDEPLYWGKIVDQQTLDGIAANTGQGKHHLNEDHAANEKTDLQADEGHHRHEGIFQGKLIDNGAWGPAIGMPHQNEL